MGEVVSPRGVTYKVTCHQWFTNGLSSILTLPTICVHRCRVRQVSFHASNGSAGQLSARSPCCVLLVLSMCCSAWLSPCPLAEHLEGITIPGSLFGVQPIRHCAPRNRDTRLH